MSQCNYPLASKWDRIRSAIAEQPTPDPTGIGKEFYLDLAEPIVRAAVAWQDSDGTIIDPYYRREANSGTARFVGALGQLIAAGRCLDLAQACAKSYEACLRRLGEVDIAPEFWTKELMYAYAALKDKIEPDRLERWRIAWLRHEPRKCYRCAAYPARSHYNVWVFALTGEFFKKREGLDGDMGLVEEALEHLAPDFTEYGMYRDPHDPMTYDLVTKQQLDLVRHYGYNGTHAEWIDDTCQRGALTSLLTQSVTGHMPYGGRSNQFHFVEGHFVCLCETRASLYKRQGDMLMAGIFKRAARKAAISVRRWILEMEPFRNLKQGFHPRLMHGLDSGGSYSCYGLLAASLFGTAYHAADEDLQEVITPAELGGYVFDLWPGFHKVFATCSGYHVEIDIRADHNKESTGLGRLHHEGAWPETALSSSISASVKFDVPGVSKPTKNLAIGPAWIDQQGSEHRLADFEHEIKQVSVDIIEETAEKVAFEVTYVGDLAGFEKLCERYELSSEGLRYGVQLGNSNSTVRILVPLIQTDGAEDSAIDIGNGRILVTYRGAIYEVTSPGAVKVALCDDLPAANRNAIYWTSVVEGNEVWLRLRSLEPRY